VSNISQIIPERSADIGSFLVGRILPFRKKRMVGPFIFIDHMGPADIKPGNYADIGQHPHIGISTLTYLFEGEILHKDSIGTEQMITPGSVNFMTSGKGVVHTERTPKHLRDGQTRRMHGFQIWVTLPKHLENMEPEFEHVPKENLPKWNDEFLDFTLIAGEAFGKKSPLKVFSNLFMLEVVSSEQTILNLQEQVKGEIGICVVNGSVTSDGQTVEKGNMLVSKTEDTCKVEVQENTHLLIFGGQPFEEERFIAWNFVSSSKETLEKAKEDWMGNGFDLISGEGPKIPLPNFINSNFK
jgi:redox-sensitive bicupin YhaK (pirin superfamily)